MLTLFSRALLTWGLLVLLGGCAGQSWFGTTHKDEMPPPQAAPVPPVEKAPVDKTSMTGRPVPPPAQAQAGKVKVAILLPLSGRNGALGQAMLNAAQQAVFDVAADNFELVPRDTGGNEEQASASAEEVLSHGAQLIIGPLFAVSVPGVRQAAQNANVSILTLSTDTSLAQSGLYVMGFAPDAQVEHVINYASVQGAHRFAALVPTNAYGGVVAQAFNMAVARANGTVVAMETYDPAHHDSNAQVQSLAQKREAIDALLLPEGGADLTQITNQLAAAGFNPKNVHVLGTGLWDVPDIGKQTPFVVGGWYAASDPAARTRFQDTYSETYGQAPPRLVTLAYDATALAAVLAKRGAHFDQASLTNPNGFAGLDGVFRLTSRGMVERRLAVLEVTPDGPKVVDPPLGSFAGAR